MTSGRWSPVRGRPVGGVAVESWPVNQRHVYPRGTSNTVTLTGLDSDASYKVRIRARYYQGLYTNAPWSGPWTEAEPTTAR